MQALTKEVTNEESKTVNFKVDWFQQQWTSAGETWMDEDTLSLVSPMSSLYAPALHASPHRTPNINYTTH